MKLLAAASAMKVENMVPSLPRKAAKVLLEVGTGSDVPEIMFGCVGSVQHPSPPPDSSGQLTPQLFSLSECNHITSGLWPHLLYKVTQVPSPPEA